MMNEPSEHIILPDMVIAGLYRQALVMPDAPEEASVAATSLPSAALPVMGEQAWNPETGGGSAPALPKDLTSASATEKETAHRPGAMNSPVPASPQTTTSTGEATGSRLPASPEEATSAHEAEAREAAAAPAPTHAAPAGKAEAPAQAYRFLGNNSRKVAVIVHFPHDTFLPEQHLQFLGKILGACKMNLGDIAIVNHAAQPVVIGKLKQQLQPAYVLLFGPAPTDIQLPLSFTPFKQQQYDGCQYLYAPSLNDLNQEGEQARPLKSQLWNCLKKMFDI